MSNIIKETLEDGTEYQFDLDLCADYADAAIAELWENEEVVENFDFTATIFNLFVSSIHILANSGWTVDNLIEEVHNHAVIDSDSDLIH